MKKIICLLLALLMTVPMLALAVGANNVDVVDCVLAGDGETPDGEETPEDEPAPVDPTFYNAANEGDVLYTANFAGDEYWTPISAEDAGEEVGWYWTNSENMTVTVDPEDSGKATIALSKQGNSAWGADLSHLPLGEGFNYTITYTLTRSSNKPIGLLFDGHLGGYAFTTKSRLQRNGAALGGHEYQLYSSMPGVVIPGTQPSESNLSVQEYAIEVNGDESSFAFYVKDADGNWIKMDSGVTDRSDGAFYRNALGLYFYSFQVTEVTVSDLNVYKGLSVVEENDDVVPPAGGEDDGSSEEDGGETTEKPNKKPNHEAPELVTEAPVEETNAPETGFGCGAAIGFGGAALVAASAVGMITISSRRKKDE